MVNCTAAIARCAIDMHAISDVLNGSMKTGKSMLIQ